MRGKYRRMAVSTAALAAALGAAGGARAQETSVATPPQNEPATTPDQVDPAQDTSSTGLQDIVVTAQRRSERVQDTPIAITALSNEGLAKANVTTLSDLSGRIPGLVVGGGLSGGGNNALSIRGVTGQVIPIGADAAVSVYLDGVYLPKPENALFTLGDVERLEVLRGPQGTLYGRNATAGAINIVTRTPGDHWSGLLDVNYGNLETYEAKAYIGGPIGGGLSVSVSGAASGNGGYYRDTQTRQKLSGSDTITGRFKLRYATPDDRLTAILAVDYTKLSGDYSLFHLGDGTLANFRYVGTSQYPFTPDDLGKRSFNTRRTRGASLQLNYNVSSHLTLTSISSVRDNNLNAFYSLSPQGGYSLNGLYLHTVNSGKFGPSYSQELRGVFQSKALTVTAGATYYRERAHNTFGQVVGPVGAPFPSNGLAAAPTAPLVRTLSESYAAFAQAELHVTPTLTGIVGLRVNHERREMSNTYPYRANTPGEERRVTDDALIPKVGINFQPNSAILVYGTVSRGYQAPGFSPATSPANHILSFRPEKLISYEVGAKTEWLDRRLRFNVTGYHYDYTNLQVRVTTGFVVTTVNANAKIDGVEVEAQALVVPGLTLFANGNYQHARYTQFCDAQVPFDRALDCSVTGTTGLTGVSRKGLALNQAPDLQANAGFDYSTDLGKGLQLLLNGSYSYQSESFFTPGEIPYTRGASYGLVNARAALQFEDGLELYVFGKNLTNVHRPTGALYTGGVLGNIVDVGQVNAPRIYGLGARLHF